MTSAKQKVITATELLAMPRDGNRYELVRGMLVQKMPTGDPHGDAGSRATILIGVYAEGNNYGVVRSGEPGYRLERDPDTVRAPDVAWIASGRIPEGTQGYPELAPDLVVEVKSPSNSNAEMAAKAQMWLCYGTRLALVLDPDTISATVYIPNSDPVTLGPDDILDLGVILPGFTVEVWRLFRREH